MLFLSKDIRNARSSSVIRVGFGRSMSPNAIRAGAVVLADQPSCHAWPLTVVGKRVAQAMEENG